MFRVVCALGCILCGVVSMVSAETEDGLYGAAVPENAVFLRVIDPKSKDHIVFGQRLLVEPSDDTVFIAFAPDILPDAEPGGYYTSVAKSGGDFVVIQEPPRSDPTKVYLTLLNVDAGTANIVVAGGGPVVLSNHVAGQALSRGVNPVSVSLAVHVDGVITEFDLTLRRKQHLSFVARAGGRVALVQDQFARVFDGAEQ